MAVGPYAWSTTANNNGTSDANVNMAEGMSPPALNNGVRGVMAGLAGWLASIGGGATYGGSSSDYTITNASVAAWSAYAASQLIALKANHTNDDTAVTLAVDGLAAKAIKTCDGGNPAIGDIVSGGIYLLAYDGTNFQILNTIAGGSYQPLDATLTALAAISYTSGTLHVTLTAADTIVLMNDTALVHTTGTETIAGAKTFTAVQTINTGGGTLVAPPGGTMLHLAASDAAVTIATLDCHGSTPVYLLRHSQGTRAAPTASQSGNTLGQLGARGYGATGFASTSRAAISLFAAENWTDTAQGAYGSLRATPAGGTSNAELFTWGNPASASELGFRGFGTPSVKTTAYTLALTDSGQMVRQNSGSSRVVTIPTFASVAFPNGAAIPVENIGAGTMVLTPDTGVTLLDPSGTSGSITLNQHDGGVLERDADTGTNTWRYRGTSA